MRFLAFLPANGLRSSALRKKLLSGKVILSEEEVSRGTRRLADAVKLREERFDQLTRHAIAVHPEEEERMRVAGENAEELTAFLEKGR